MDEEKMISDMRKVLLDYCITDLRSNEAARNGHKDDYTVLDYGKYAGAKTLAITVLEHIPEYVQDDKKKMKEFFFWRTRRSNEQGQPANNDRRR